MTKSYFILQHWKTPWKFYEFKWPTQQKMQTPPGTWFHIWYRGPRLSTISHFHVCHSDSYISTSIFLVMFCSIIRKIESDPLPYAWIFITTIYHCRCIYAPKKLTTREQQQLDVLKEECVYTCGRVLMPTDHPLHDVAFVEPNPTCASHVATHYFASRTNSPLVCYSCGSGTPDAITDTLKKNFQSVHPVCSECRENGISERTRGNRDLKRKR